MKFLPFLRGLVSVVVLLWIGYRFIRLRKEGKAETRLEKRVKDLEKLVGEREKVSRFPRQQDTKAVESKNVSETKSEYVACVSGAVSGGIVIGSEVFRERDITPHGLLLKVAGRGGVCLREGHIVILGPSEEVQIIGGDYSFTVLPSGPVAVFDGIRLIPGEWSAWGIVESVGPFAAFVAGPGGRCRLVRAADSPPDPRLAVGSGGDETADDAG